VTTGRVLAVWAGLVLSALALAAPALAAEAVMCKAKEEKCAEGNRYAAKTEFKAPLAEGTESVLESSQWRTRCAEGQIAGTSTSLTAGEITILSFGACKPLKEPPGIRECYGEETLHLPYVVKFVTKEPGGEKGIGVERMRLSAGKNGDPALKFNCEVSGFKFWCVFSQKELDLFLVGGEPAEVRLNKVLLKLTESSSETLCTTEMAWSAIYTVTTPSPLFFSGA
jgi:hypothetical protein